MQDENNIPLILHCQITTYCHSKMLLQKVYYIHILQNIKISIQFVSHPYLSTRTLDNPSDNIKTPI
jgi:hypothetical protein